MKPVKNYQQFLNESEDLDLKTLERMSPDELGDLLFRKNVLENTEIVQRIIDLGANVDVRDGSNETPLHRAAYYGAAAVCNILLNLGLDVDDDANEEGKTPLHYAAMSGNAETCMVLLDVGDAFMNLEDYKTWTPLHYAAWLGSVEICKMLLKRNPDLRHLENDEDETPWDLADDMVRLKVPELRP